MVIKENSFKKHICVHFGLPSGDEKQLSLVRNETLSGDEIYNYSSGIDERHNDFCPGTNTEKLRGTSIQHMN